MTRLPMCRYMLVLIQVFDLASGSLRQIQFHAESSNGNAMVIARGALGITRALFDPSNSIVVIVPGNSTTNVHANSLTDNILRILANEENTENTVTIVNESGFRSHISDVDQRMRDWDSSYLIIENHLENLRRILDVKTIPKWSEYLVVTRLTEDSVRNLMNSLWLGDVLRVAFLHTNDGRELVLQSFDKVPRNSSDLLEPKMRISRVKCGRKFCKLEDHIRTFPFAVCPDRACSLWVGPVKSDMVGSAAIAESRRVFDSANRIVSLFVNKYGIEWRNRSEAPGNWTETLDLIRRDEIDMTHGSFIPRSEGSEFLDAVGWFAFDRVMFVDATQYMILGPLTNIFIPLDRYSWLCLGVSLGLYSAFVAMVGKARERKLVGESITHFDIWAILLGQSVKIPVKIGFRAVLGMWIVASLLINAAYGCDFKSSLATFTRIQTLKTINDINNSGRLIAGTEVARELFGNYEDQADRAIYERWKIVKPEEVFSVVLQDRIVGVDYALNVKLYNLLHRKSFQPSLYTLKDPILVHSLNFYLKKRHPYIRHLQSLVGRARAAGIMEKWDSDDFMVAAQLAGRTKGGRHRWSDKLGMSHMKVAWKLWGSGNIIALIVFFYERYKRCRRHGTIHFFKNHQKTITSTDNVKNTKK